MFCEKCGNKLKENHKFCTKCGHVIDSESKIKTIISNDLEQKWWYRIAKVIYIILYSPLLIVVPVVWIENSSSYSARYEPTYGKAYFYSLLVLLIYVFIVRLIKIAFFYITFGQKPHWKKEFKKFF